MKKLLGIFLLTIFLGNPLKSQFEFYEWGIGVSGIYNFQTAGLGFGGRGYFAFGDHFALIPKYNLYPGINFSPNLSEGIKENYLALNVHYKLNPQNRWHFYLLLDASYNKWKNYALFTTPRAQLRSFALEGGVGVMRSSGCLRPFAEMDYNAKWRESNFRVGIYIFFQDCFGGVTPNGYKRRRYICP